MVEKILMPKLAMAMRHGVVVEWRANEGEWVEKGQIVMVIETEKVTYEVESPASGLLHIMAKVGDKIPINKTVALMVETEEELAQIQAGENAQVEEKKEDLPATTALLKDTMPAESAEKGKIKIAPVAKKLAQRHNLDITRIIGTGPHGRIIKRDVQKALAIGIVPATAGIDALPAEIFEGRRVLKTIPMTGMRKAISDHVMHSLAVSAQLTASMEIDMTEMIRVRRSLVKKEQEIGTRITYTDLFVYAITKAVKHMPLANSSLINDEIKIWQEINVGVAVALETGEFESGLIVPVVKDCGNKSLPEISRAIKDLVTRARNRQLTLDDLEGGTISLSNTGTYVPHWIVSTPIINQPQSMIVLTGGIFDRPVARKGEVVVRPIMIMSVTFDHRVLDGTTNARFYTKLKELIENPELLHL